MLPFLHLDVQLVGVASDRPQRNRAKPVVLDPSRVGPPPLAQLKHINNDFSGLSVRVAVVAGKGLGLMAQRRIESGEVIAKYLTRLYTKAGHAFSEYAIGALDGRLVNDLFAGSFPPVGADGISFLAPLANELSEGGAGEYNAKLVLFYEDVDKRQSLFGLVAMRAIAVDEEILWFYGKDYPRDYCVKNP